MKTANQGGNDILRDFVLKTGGTNFFYEIYYLFLKCVITVLQLLKSYSKNNTKTQKPLFHKNTSCSPRFDQRYEKM